MIIVAVNIDQCSVEGGLDDAVKDIISYAKEIGFCFHISLTCTK